MNSLFNFGGEKLTVREQARTAKREVTRSQRDLDREVVALERNEKELIAQVKKAAKQGDTAGTAILAKQIVRLRAQKDQLRGMKYNIGSVGMNIQTAATTSIMSETMVSATGAMTAMNANMNPAVVARTMAAFAQESAKMEMAQEVMDDALIDAFEDDATEVDAVVGQVLSEIGLDLGAMLVSAPQHRIAGQTATENAARAQAAPAASAAPAAIS